MLYPSIDFKFTDIHLLPSYKGQDGKPYRYGDQLLTGSACIEFDHDGDWAITEISLETTEKADTASGWETRQIYKFAPFYSFVKEAIARECGDEITEAVYLAKKEAA